MFTCTRSKYEPANVFVAWQLNEVVKFAGQVHHLSNWMYDYRPGMTKDLR